MTYAAQMRKMEALRRREERESKRLQKELARRAKEHQKLSELDAARLEVETFENELDVILSIHKEAPETFDWAALAFALPPMPPRNPELHRTLHEVGLEIGDWLNAVNEAINNRNKYVFLMRLLYVVYFFIISVLQIVEPCRPTHYCTSPPNYSNI